VLDYEQTVALEPALGMGRTRFAGAIHDTSDGTGDPQQFAHGLSAVCQRLGVTFHLGTSVTRLDTDGSPVTRIMTSDGQFGRRRGPRRRISQPAAHPNDGPSHPGVSGQGYTLTATIKDPDRAPRIGGTISARRRTHRSIGIDTDS
jgi:D-amino-acid dehydrogenase